MMIRKCISLTLLLATAAFCQLDRGRIVGTVKDASGAAIANARIVVEDAATARKREILTGPDGTYNVEALLPATYTITASNDGFADATVSNVVLQAGQQRQLDLSLQPASVTNTVTVDSGALASVETESASLAGTVSQLEVDNLPLNGRQLSQLYILVPGATNAGSGTFDNIRFAGRANEENMVRYDGIAATTLIDSNPANNGDSPTQYRLNQSLENVQEFHVESSNYNAQYGDGTGGMITVITKSGTNEFHGGLFEYFRNDKLDARNFYDPRDPAPLRLNQYGGSIGGPILKDKLFFFASQENLNQRVYAAFNQLTLSDCARGFAVPGIRPVLAAYPTASGALAPCAAGVGLDGQNPLALLASNSGVLASAVDEHFGSIRLDYDINSRNRLYLRYQRDQGTSYQPSDLSGSGRNSPTTPQNAIADLTTTVTPNIVNDLKVGYNGNKSRAITQGVSLPGLDLSNVTIRMSTGAQAASTGIITPTGAGSAPLQHAAIYTTYDMDFIDTVSWVHGAHSFKFGAEIMPRRLYIDQLGGVVYQFTSVANFLQNAPSIIQMDGDLAESPSPFHNGATGIREGENIWSSGFIQDEWKVTPNLTLNLGLRYDYFSPLREKHDLEVAVNPVTGQFLPQGADVFHAAKDNFGPRVGVAWSPQRFGGNTVFRIGAGYFYGPGQGEDEVQPILNDVAGRTFNPASPLQYPIDRAGLLTGYNINDPNLQYQPRVYGANYSIPERVLSYTANIQQTLPDKSVLTVGYQGSHGTNLFLRGLANRITGVDTNPVTGAAIITREFGNKFAELDVKTSGGFNYYNSLQVAWNRRFSHGFSAALQYQWAHNIGNSGGSNEAHTTQNNYDVGADYGNTLFDIRQSLNAMALYSLPLGKGHRFDFGGNPVLNFLLGQWNAGGQFNFHTGLPINVQITRPDVVYQDKRTGLYYQNPVVVNGVVETAAVANTPGGGNSRGVQRPDLVLGVDPYLHGSDGSTYLNPAAFSVPAPGTYGNLASNAFSGPGFAQLDMNLSKRFMFTERVNVELRADLYNVLNHPNFSATSTDLASNLGAGLPSSPSSSGLQPGQPLTAAAAGTGFGSFKSTVSNYIGLGTARQLQLSLRLNF